MAGPPKTLGRNDPSEYYDVLMVGRTGMGKSTTSNKLLGIDNKHPSVSERMIKAWGKVKNAVKYFEPGDGSDSVTKDCKLLSNETEKVRVLDTPGFADSEAITKSGGVRRGNLQIFRWILRNQEEHSLAFRRVLYFLPNRGSLERADGTLHEEIKAMYEFLGQDIFNIMIIIATNKQKHQVCGFDDDDISKTRKAFTKAFKTITNQDPQECPPIYYLSFDEKDCLVEIQKAKVIQEMQLKYILPTPVVIDVKPTTSIDDLIEKYPAKRLRFQDVCARCTGKLICETFPTGERTTKIVYENGDELTLDKSKCHPIFVPKQSTIIDIIEGVIHLTLSSAPAVEKAVKETILPWISDEICPACNEPPGSVGCSEMGEVVEVSVKMGKKKIKTSHSTVLDSFQIECFVKN